MNKFALKAILCLTLIAPAFTARADLVGDTLSALQGAPQTDLASFKLQIDHLVDPKIDISQEVATLETMELEVRAMLPPNAPPSLRLAMLRRYLYTPGPWNGGKVFTYDHADPYGQDIRNKLLSDYLADRRGNCVTMPILLAGLGQRLGLKITLAAAPLHLLVKFTDENGVTWNLEATSGGGPARESHYRRLLPISDRALQSGIYLTPLSPRENRAVIAQIVQEKLMDDGAYDAALRLADGLLQEYPLFIHVLLKKGTSAYYLLKTEFYTRYPSPSDVPPALRPRLAALEAINTSSFTKAEALGWQPFDPAAPLQPLSPIGD